MTVERRSPNSNKCHLIKPIQTYKLKTSSTKPAPGVLDLARSSIFICGCSLYNISRMLGTFFVEGASMSPQSHCASNLHTTFTTTLVNASGQEGQVASMSYRRGRDFFENSLCFKLEELQEKSSKIISKLPSIHSKIIKAQGYSRPTEYPFLSSDGLYANKLKIIRDLEHKIDQLESNINNPLLPHEQMREIQREINLDFENYYQEIKVAGQQDKPESEDSFDSKDEVENLPQNGKNREYQTQTSILSISQYPPQPNIVVCLPKIIEIEIPYEVYRPKEVQRHSQSRSSSEEPGSLPGQSIGNSSCPKSEENNSIGNIINRFNDRCYPALPPPEAPYTYRISTVQHQDIVQREEFHLPLNSYENCRSERGKSSNGNIHRLNKIQHSQLSSEEEMDHRDDIWNKEELGFNQEHLSLVKEKEHASSQHNSHSDHFDEERERVLIELNAKISALTQQNLALRGELEEGRREREELVVQIRVVENRGVEMEIDYLQEMERMDQLREQNRELNALLIASKEALFKAEGREAELLNRVRQMERDFASQLEERETEFQEVLKLLHQKEEQLEQLGKINEEIKGILSKKQKAHETHVAQLETLLHDLKEELAYYKGKFQDEGISLKLEQADYIRELLEKREEEERQKMQMLDNRYKNKLQELKTQKEQLQAQLDEMKSPSNAIAMEGLAPELQKQLNNLLSTYNSQLFKKDEEISHLRKLSSEYRKLSQHSSEQQVRVITSIKNLLIGQRIDRRDISNDLVQCVYVIDRLLRTIKVFEYTATREKEERTKMTQKVTTLNLFFNKQLEKAEEKNLGLQAEKHKLKRQTQEISRELKKCTQKLEFYRGKLQSPACKGQIYNIFELQNEYLQLENRKMQAKYDKIKRYSEQLEGQFLADFIQSGNSFCDKFCPHREVPTQNKEQQQFCTKINHILRQIKEQAQKSTLFNPQESGFGQCPTASKIQNCRLASGVFAITNKPATKQILPKLATAPAVIKALLTPLPEIPKSVSPTPAPSITLDKLLEKRICSSGTYREKVAVKLLQLGIELNKVSKKLFSLRPCQILINCTGGEVEIILRREFGSASEQDQSMLTYRAPQVLLGFNQSEASYVWTIGLIIDHIYHEKLFYRKINDVMSRKNNYYVRNQGLKLKPLLQKMLVKNHKERPSLAKAREEMLQLCAQ